MNRLVWCHCLAGLLAIPLMSGCASFNARIAAFMQCRAEERVQQAHLCQQKLEMLKAELEQERESIRQEREMELQALHAETERQRDCARGKVDESVRTKVGIDLDQRVKLGQLQVDMNKLQQIMEEREADFQFRKKLYDDMKDQRELQARAGMLAQMRAMEGRTRDQQAAVSAPQDCSCGAAAQCSCGPQAHSCACGAAASCSCGALLTCNIPNMLPLKDCGGPNLPVREPLKQPVKQPILPTEIPLHLPVTLEVNMENVNLGSSRVRQLPVRQFTQPLKQACQPKNPCGRCANCQIPPACDAPKAAINKARPSIVTNAPPQESEDPEPELTESAPANYAPPRGIIPNAKPRTATNDYFHTPRTSRPRTREPEPVPGTADQESRE